jgi:hypothetical protein
MLILLLLVVVPIALWWLSDLSAELFTVAAIVAALIHIL